MSGHQLASISIQNASDAAADARSPARRSLDQVIRGQRCSGPGVYLLDKA